MGLLDVPRGGGEQPGREGLVRRRRQAGALHRPRRQPARDARASRAVSRPGKEAGKEKRDLRGAGTRAALQCRRARRRPRQPRLPAADHRWAHLPAAPLAGRRRRRWRRRRRRRGHEPHADGQVQVEDPARARDRRHLRRRGGLRGLQAGADRDRRVPQEPHQVLEAGRQDPTRCGDGRAAWHGQDAPRARRGRRGGRTLHLGLGLGVRRDVRRRRRLARAPKPT